MSTTILSRAPEDLMARDRELLIHPYLPGSVEERVVMTEGSGCRLRDIEGREYLDATGGLWLAQIGHGRPEMAEVRPARCGGSSTSRASGSSATIARSSWRSGSSAWRPGGSTTCTSRAAGPRATRRRSGWRGTSTIAAGSAERTGSCRGERLPRHRLRIGHGDRLRLLPRPVSGRCSRTSAT